METLENFFVLDKMGVWLKKIDREKYRTKFFVVKKNNELKLIFHEKTNDEKIVVSRIPRIFSPRTSNVIHSLDKF